MLPQITLGLIQGILPAASEGIQEIDSFIHGAGEAGESARALSLLGPGRWRGFMVRRWGAGFAKFGMVPGSNARSWQKVALGNVGT